MAGLSLAAVGRNHVAVLVRPPLADGGRLVMLDGRTGKTAQALKLPAAKGVVQQRFAVPPPAMTSGRLCVDSDEGVIVYGSR